jgi:flavin reductase (DIM6/NTAB) family NADH-FMN oxidoreductase RutF
MVSSPIWWVELDGNLVSMTLDTNSYTIQTIQKNQVFSVEFDLMFSKSAYRQRL